MKVSGKRRHDYEIIKDLYSLGKVIDLSEIHHVMAIAKSSGHEPKNYFKGFQVGVYELFGLYRETALFYLLKTIYNGVNEPIAPVLQVTIDRDGSIATIRGQKFFCGSDRGIVAEYMPSDKMEDHK